MKLNLSPPTDTRPLLLLLHLTPPSPLPPRRRSLRLVSAVIRCMLPPSSFAACRRTQPHRTPLCTPPPSPLPPRRCSLRVVSAVVRCTSPPPSFAACRQPSPPTPVNQKNTPSTATYVRLCAPLSTMMAKVQWDDDGDGATGDGATGYDDDNDGDWRQRRWRRRNGRRLDRRRRRR
jgi:hypothetical protein